MIRRPPRSTQSRSSAASDVYKRQVSQRNNPFNLPHFLILINDLFRIFKVDRNGYAGVFSFFGLLRFDDSTGVIKDRMDLFNLCGIAFHNEFIEIIGPGLPIISINSLWKAIPQRLNRSIRSLITPVLSSNRSNPKKENTPAYPLRSTLKIRNRSLISIRKWGRLKGLFLYETKKPE